MIYSDLPIVMVRCLTLTIIIELLAAIIFGVRNQKDIINIMLVNILTNPIVVSLPILIYMNFGYLYYRIAFYSLEILAVIIEGFVYYKVFNYRRINPFLLALILNLFSYGIGEIINYLI